MKKINCPNVAKNLFILLIVSLVFAIYFQSNAYALTSDNINFQGKIVRNDTGFEGLNVVPGSPACVVDGAGNDTCDFQVAYYTASTAGTLLLTETFTNVEIGQYDGVFELSLGSGSMTTTSQCRDGTCNTPVEVISEYKDLYLELKFSPDGTNLTETFTRMPLEASPYAILSKYAEGANDAFKLSTSVSSGSQASPVTGMVYYNTTTSQLTVYNGTSWEGIKSSLWTDAGTFTYLTSTTDDLVLGATTVSDSTFFFDMDGSSGSYLEIDDASNTNRLLTILSGGNVGIGTATPGAKLEVAGSASTITNASGDLTISTGGLNGNILLSPHGTGKVLVSTSLGIKDTGATPTHYTYFQGGGQAGDITYTLPTSSTTGLLKNTAGVLSWDTSTYITGLNWSQITNGVGIYMNYQPNNTACGAGQVLKYTVGTGWTCADDTDTNTDVLVAVDSSATAGYLGATGTDGVLRVSSPISLTDGGDYITLGIVANSISGSHLVDDTLDYVDFDDTLDLDANLTQNQSTYTWTQNFTGTTTTGLTYNANSLTSGTANLIASTSTAGLASGSSYLLRLTRSGANTNLAHTAYGVYSTVTNTNVTSGTNIAGYFSASGATTANYGLLVANGNVGIGTTTPSNKFVVNSSAYSTIELQYGGTSVVDIFSNASSNIFIGLDSGSVISTGTGNIALGDNALSANTTGLSNTAIGHYALDTNVAKQGSTALGYQAMMYANSTAIAGLSYNTAIGYQALTGSGVAANNTGTQNTAVGHQSMTANTSGSSNTALGVNTLNANTTGTQNVAIGQNALFTNVAKRGSVAIGYEAMRYANSTTTAGLSNNTAIGYQALYGSTTPANNTGINITALGFMALYSNTAGNNNVAIGERALYSNTTGNSNVASGAWALETNTTGSDNVASGVEALHSNTTGNNNVASGYGALYSNVGKVGSVAIGYNAMRNADSTTSNTTTYNTAIGYEALYGSTTPANNTGIGNTVLGYQSGFRMTSGSNNVLLGYLAGDGITSGGNNIMIGYNTDGTAGSSNQLNIGDSIYGNLSNDYISIGDSTPTEAMFTVGATSQFRVDTTGDLIRIKNVPYVWPSSNASGILANNGSGTLSWSTLASLGGVTGTGAGTATAGQITWWNGTSTITGENDFYWDASNNRLGIGTSTPTASIDIAGASSTISNASGDITITPANNLIVDLGNVGIGDKTPASLLTVGNGDLFQVRSTGELGIGVAPNTSYSIYTTGRLYGIYARGSTVGGRFYDTDEYSSTYVAFGSYGLYTAQNGYFGGTMGIGATAPSSKLEVSSASGGVSDFIGLKRSGTDWRIWVSDGTTGTPSLRIGGNAVNSYAWQFDWTGTNANIFKSPNDSVNQIVLAVRGAGSQVANIFQVQNSSGTGMFNVASNGSVGIGTTSPAIRLAIGDTDTGFHWNSDGNLSLYTNNVSRLNVDNTGTVRVSNPSGGYALGVGRLSGQPTIQATNDWLIMDSNTAGAALNYYSSQPVYLAYGGGNVGVKRATASYALDVNGNIRSNNEIISVLGSYPGQFRAISGNYGFFIRNDGSATYFMLTASGDAYGSWSSLRPLSINNASGYVTFGNGHGDISERFNLKGTAIKGMILSSEESSKNVTMAIQNSSPIGVISTAPAVLMGFGGHFEVGHDTKEVYTDEIVPLALVGTVPVIVTTENGAIYGSDSITVSKIPGVGAKVVKSGYTVGTALESTSDWNATSCPMVSSVESIIWPVDNTGENISKPCFKLPDGTYIGKILVVVGTSWYDAKETYNTQNISNPNWYRIAQLNGTDANAKFKIKNNSVGSYQNLLLNIDTVSDKDIVNIVSNFTSGGYDISKARINNVGGIKYLEIYLEEVNNNSIVVNIDGQQGDWISTSITQVIDIPSISNEFAFNGVLFGISDMLQVEDTGLKVGGDLIASTTTANIGDTTSRWNDIYAKGAIRLGSGSGQEGAIRFNTESKRLELSNDGSTWVQLGDLTSQMVISPEYPGAILFADGSDNLGKMTSDAIEENATFKNYYEWISNKEVAQDYDILVRITLPNDFVSWKDDAIYLDYMTQNSVSVENNSVDVTLIGSSGVDAQSVDHISTLPGAWERMSLKSLDINDCNAPGDSCTLRISLTSSMEYFTRVGDITLNYNRSL